MPKWPVHCFEGYRRNCSSEGDVPFPIQEFGLAVISLNLHLHSPDLSYLFMWGFPKIRGPTIDPKEYIGLLLQGHSQKGLQFMETAMYPSDLRVTQTFALDKRLRAVHQKLFSSNSARVLAFVSFGFIHKFAGMGCRP